MSKQSFNQEWIHFLITKRQFSNFDMNIKDELIKIRKLGEKYYGKYIDYYPRYIGLRKFIKKILKTIFGKKLLNFVGKIFISIGNKFTSIK